LRVRGPVGEPAYDAVGVHGDPGYLRGQRLSPVADPVAAAADEGVAVLEGPDAVVPMLVRGDVIGALHEHVRDGVVDEDRVRLLSRLADQLGLVIESARLRADQEETVARLRELDEMKTDFVAITSHELRTPLAGIRGFADMLRRRGEELSRDEREEFLDIVLLQTDRLIKLVEDLLVVSRIEADRMTLEPEETDLRPFLERVVRAIGDGSERVRVEPSPGAPSTMLVDPTRLSQIVTNLVHNALKFSSDDVLLAWNAPAEGTVAFAVTDRGVGIAEDQLQRVFERFHQAERSNAHTQGFGLGLHITRLLTEAMGGWVEVTSALGEGTTFTVTLPSSRSLPGPARRSAAASSD
jgi:signal transduction histidine kinase